MADSSNVTIGGHAFVCVRLEDANFTDIAAIYVVLCVYGMPSNQYTKEDRQRVEKSLRSQFNPPCGQR